MFDQHALDKCQTSNNRKGQKILMVRGITSDNEGKSM